MMTTANTSISTCLTFETGRRRSDNGNLGYGLEQLLDFGDGVVLFDGDGHFAPKLETERSQREAADDGYPVVDEHDLAVGSQFADATRHVHFLLHAARAPLVE